MKQTKTKTSKKENKTSLKVKKTGRKKSVKAEAAVPTKKVKKTPSKKVRSTSSKSAKKKVAVKTVKSKRTLKKAPKAVKQLSKKALDKIFKDYNYDMFVEGLKQIGRPALTKEIAERVAKNPNYKKLAVHKRRFMQFLYSAASHFIKQDVLKRTPVGEKSFQYALKTWKAQKPATHRIAA